jgi:hypothetical protein
LRGVAAIGHEDAASGKATDEACMSSRAIPIMLGLCTAVLVLSGLYLARSILAPVAFSLFVVAIVWPLQRALETRLPRLLALVVTLVMTLLVFTVLGYLIVWAFGTVGRWVIENALRFQALYVQWNDWLAEHGILVTSLLVENFNASWLIRAVQEIGLRLHGLATFVVITFVFTALGLLEVDIARKNIEILGNREAARTILGRDRLRLELHPVHRPAGRDRVSDRVRAGAGRLLAIGYRCVPVPEPHPVPDRKLPGTAHRRRRLVGLSVPGVVCGLLLGLPLGHPGRVHRRADRDRSSHALRPARLHALDRDAAVGKRAQGRVGLRQHL